MTHRKLIAIDFDGVLHAYTSPWTDAATISDSPTEGAMAFLRSLVEDERFEVVIVSSRLKDPAGLDAVRVWLRNRLWQTLNEREPGKVFDALTFSVERPPAFLTLDDRAWNFDGRWPSLDEVAAFKPWNKRPAGTPEGRSQIDNLIARTAAATVAREEDDTPVVVRTSGTLAGKPRLRSTRVEVETLFDYLADGHSIAEVLDTFETLDAEDCHRAIIEAGRLLASSAPEVPPEECDAEYDAEAVRLASEGIPVKTYPPAVASNDD